MVAIVTVVILMISHTAAEIDARQYASFSDSYASFPPDLRRDIAHAMKSGRISKSDYSSLVRESLDDGVVLDWANEGVLDTARERARLARLIKDD
ncbi:hypothetical protein LMG29739_05430 [Paraburkholderia solisilvae]|uniref:Uncharacterized protein n=2 Tax=Paraburkholderia solisilvae TaxID=624376 RepID=A0A6J5ES15_9BURK|nr:hypothetical protein LMG29739_05430 [Paraburkholderia solisilvae]